MTPERRSELVFALCHELSNLLAAVRLRAHLIAPDADPRELRGAAARLAEISLRAGALVAQVRPLLEPAAGPALSVPPAEVLAALEQALEDGAERRLQVAVEEAASLPSTRVDPALLHQLLLSTALAALERVEHGGLRVRAEARGDEVAFVVEDRAPAGPPREERLTGGALAQALAQALLAPFGGRVEATRSESGSRVEFLLPASA